MKSSSISPISTNREPENSQTTPSQQKPVASNKRGFQPPDASMPGPISRFYPLDGEPEDGSAGGDSFSDRGDSQNSDRI